MQYELKATNESNLCRLKDIMSIFLYSSWTYAESKNKTTQHEQPCYELPKLQRANSPLLSRSSSPTERLKVVLQISV
jgi:hypothetical protein